ncbi:hypothetical protein CORMATOL_01634 [Corynebacterium matruchotii ATCC 33806]|uniref:Uncharacterized protein n=1 Tax=Corynebacterium matruchotii ATCC 33806 TaxID=566549 RepID=C0E3R9_9CORY|nr:hypothetical protein CORMATOL_01634 [Corynebacterium matruchotii ATCC 33806]
MYIGRYWFSRNSCVSGVMIACRRNPGGIEPPPFYLVRNVKAGGGAKSGKSTPICSNLKLK